MFLFVASAFAYACDQAVFSAIQVPLPGSDGHGVATATTTLAGKTVVGGAFTRYSEGSAETWRAVLADAESQDQWVPKKFGYQKSDHIDADHLYLALDLAFLFDSVHVQRQLVVQVQNDTRDGQVRSCWWMVDPNPYMGKIAGWVSDAPWEREMMGRWTVTPQPDGRQLVAYQWWAEAGRVPTSIQRYALGRTLPELLDAFEERVKQLEGKR